MKGRIVVVQKRGELLAFVFELFAGSHDGGHIGKEGTFVAVDVEIKSPVLFGTGKHV